MNIRRLLTKHNVCSIFPIRLIGHAVMKSAAMLLFRFIECLRQAKIRETERYCYSNRTWRESGPNVSFTSWNSTICAPFLQLNFLLRLILGEICCNSFNMIRRAFCGNGFIHLNIAEIHEEDIGGQKTCTYFGDQRSKWAISTIFAGSCIKFVK